MKTYPLLMLVASLLGGCDTAPAEPAGSGRDVEKLRDGICDAGDTTAEIEACAALRAWPHGGAYDPRKADQPLFGVCHRFGRGSETHWVLARNGQLPQSFDANEKTEPDGVTVDAMSVRRIAPESYGEQRALEKLVAALQAGEDPPADASGMLAAIHGLAKIEGALRPLTSADDGSTYLPPVRGSARVECDHSCSPTSRIYLRSESKSHVMVETHVRDGGAWVCRLWPVPKA